jgi:hypothetical protein
MRVAVPLIALLLTTAASAQQSAPVQLPPGSLTGLVLAPPNPSPVCRDRIQEVRRELGKPDLERDASPEDPLFIAAVDKRIGGCSVMVMRNDTSDIRPLPAPQEHRLMPAK